MRRPLLWILVLGMAGTLGELFLLEHTDDYWQKSPLLLLGLGLIVVIVHGLRPDKRTTRAMTLVMLLFLVAGAVGLYQHFTGNREFELEMNPARHGWELTWESLKGATPALAPGVMIYLGLLGLAAVRALPGETQPDVDRVNHQ